MPNSEKVLPPCFKCGSTKIIRSKGIENDGCANCYAKLYLGGIHPNRLKAENLVPASELEALVKVLESVGIMGQDEDDGPEELCWCGEEIMAACVDHIQECEDVRKALAHAREILKGGKG